MVSVMSDSNPRRHSIDGDGARCRGSAALRGVGPRVLVVAQDLGKHRHQITHRTAARGAVELGVEDLDPRLREPRTYESSVSTSIVSSCMVRTSSIERSASPSR